MKYITILLPLMLRTVPSSESTQMTRMLQVMKVRGQQNCKSKTQAKAYRQEKSRDRDYNEYIVFENVWWEFTGNINENIRWVAFTIRSIVSLRAYTFFQSLIGSSINCIPWNGNELPQVQFKFHFYRRADLLCFTPPSR